MTDEKEPTIQTQWGPVTPAYRKQAALNLRNDQAHHVGFIARFGLDRLRRDFPEALDGLSDADLKVDEVVDGLFKQGGELRRKISELETELAELRSKLETDDEETDA